MRGRTICLVTGLALTTAVLPAQAHYVKQSGTLYQEGSACTAGWTEMSHGDYNKGYAKFRTESKKDAPPPVYPWDCVYGYSRPLGYLAVRGKVYQDFTGTDPLCTDWGWKYNQYGSADTLTWAVHFQGVPSGGSCTGWGDYYASYGGHYVKYGGTFKGDWLFSGWHWLPVTEPRQEKLAGYERGPKPALPAWVDPHTMIVDQSQMPFEMAVQFGGPS